MAVAPAYEAIFRPANVAPDSFWTSLRYFSLYRILVAALFLGASIAYEQPVGAGAADPGLFRWTSSIYLLTAILLHALLRNLREAFNVQLSVHVLLDVLAITLLMHASGGVRSGLGVMLLISVTGAALVAPSRLTFLYAALASIALLLEQGYWLLAIDASTESLLQPALLAASCFVVAGATGWLGQRVAANELLARRRGRELETQTRINQLVIADMQDGVLVIDREGRISEHNPQALRMLGSETLRGAQAVRMLPGAAGVLDIVGEPDAQVSVETSGPGRVKRSGTIEVRGRELRIRQIETGTDEEYSVLFLEDTTRSRDQARQLKLAALGRLTANIAHEIRNPLSAISHAAELLGEASGGETPRLVRIIGDNTRRLDRLVADVLQLNRRDRVSADRIQLVAWLMSFIQEFVANESAGPERFEIAAQRDACIGFDREHFRQVMWNLLRNAVRHSSNAARSIRITLRCVAGQVEIGVLDDGPGVRPADQPKLFEPFFTTESTGTGLGLYLARELCAANDATLEYVDAPLGAHFRIVCAEAELE